MDIFSKHHMVDVIFSFELLRSKIQQFGGKHLSGDHVREIHKKYRKHIYLLLLWSQSLFILGNFSSTTGKQTFFQEVCDPNNKCQV